MLREVFHTMPPPDNLIGLRGLAVSSQFPSATSETSIILLGYTPDVLYWQFDGATGKYIKKVPVTGTGFLGMSADPLQTSRNGALWGKNSHPFAGQAQLVKYALSETDIKPAGQTLDIAHFGPNMLPNFGEWALDDSVNILMNARGRDLYVFELASGKHKYTMTMPNTISAICLEDNSRCYIYMVETQVVMLYDYVRGEVLGAAKIPRKAIPTSENPSLSTRMTWDFFYRRILLVEHTPNKPKDTIIRGYSLVNEPVRLTRPIPLRLPRQGRVIPVLVQVVDDMNHGVGGYMVEAEVL